MRTAAILPVKSFAAAKQRLSPTLGSGSRQALALAMVSDVLGALRRVDGVEEVFVVTAERTVEAAARGGRVRVLHDPAETGQSSATGIGIDRAAAEGFERVVLIPGDTPLLDPRELDVLLARAEEQSLDVAIVPDRHGAGTNALVLRPPHAITPSFGPGSLKRHVTAAEQASLRFEVVEIPSLMHDVDDPADLHDLSAALDERRGHAPLTQGALRQLGRMRAAPPVEV
ncbi:MAG TPA: 2-phospho-L-lactate guanylyltransferase [Thermoleophilaceae bacterium]